MAIHPRRVLRLLLTLLLPALPTCSTPADPGRNEGSTDTTEPFPIDAAIAPGSPLTYKGLPLQLASNGEPPVTHVDGVIGVVCVGMSNARQECGTWIAGLEGPWGDEVNPAVRVVNCARGGHAIERWIDPEFDEVLWNDCLEVRLAQAGLEPEQVLVVHHKAANQFTLGPGGSSKPLYPAEGSDHQAFLTNLSAFAQRVPEFFPAAVAVYTSSRSWGGFADRPARGEPLSYEEGHALNTWLRANPTVGGIWHGWGGYLWAPTCDEGPRNGSGVCYVRRDFVADGVHPSAQGRRKIARITHQRLLEHAWYRR